MTPDDHVVHKVLESSQGFCDTTRAMKKTSNDLPIAVHVTTCRLFAHATVGNLRIGFDADGAKLEPHNFRATCAHSTDDGREVAMTEIPERVQIDCAREISAEVARRIEISKPRKLTFAQVQRIYGRAVD